MSLFMAASPPHTHTYAHSNQNHHRYSLRDDESAVLRLEAGTDLGCGNTIIKIETVSKTPRHTRACERHICLSESNPSVRILLDDLLSK